MGGTVALHARRGDRVGLVDLTRGELGSNGTPDERVAEAAEASAVLGAVLRLNLALPDGCLSVDDEGQVDAVVRCVRAHRPRAIAIPHWEDRHPDHGNASRLLRQAIFRAGLRRVVTADEPWRPEWVCHYFINDAAPPSFVVDVSEVYEIKRQALACHRTQFTPAGDAAAATRLTSPLVLAADREPRRPVRRAGRRPLRRRLRRARAGGAAAPVQGLAGRPGGDAACVSAAARRHRRRGTAACASASSATPRSAAAASSPPSWRRAWPGAATRSTSSAARSRSACATRADRSSCTRSRRPPTRCSASRNTCSRCRPRSSTWRGRTRWTSSTRTTRCRTPPAPTWPGRSSPRTAPRCRRSSRRCTAPTSRWSAPTRRTARRSPSASSSRTA